MDDIGAHRLQDSRRDRSSLAATRTIAVIVTRNRPELLEQCLAGIAGQCEAPDEMVVVDNASAHATQAVLARARGVRTLRMVRNAGGAGGFWVGIAYALSLGADWLWLMDDDGRPADARCLARLRETAAREQADMVGALVLDADSPERLAFPIRLLGRTMFEAAEVRRHGMIPGFAHLFNGVLVRAGLFTAIGLPDPRFLLRGDEVEFLYRARRAGAAIVLDTGAAFLHPGSAAEIHPILFGRFYATLPIGPVKQALQFRNRAYIFRHYGMWAWLAADVVRYGWLFLISRRMDGSGYVRWLGTTLSGLRGEFMQAGRACGETKASLRSEKNSHPGAVRVGVRLHRRSRGRSLAHSDLREPRP